MPESPLKRHIRRRFRRIYTNITSRLSFRSGPEHGVLGNAFYLIRPRDKF